ncbi:MAG: hypothetical protein ACOWWO_15315 [Peptococcaceae bacterium]
MDFVSYLIHSLFLFFIFKSLISLFLNNKNANSIDKSPEVLEDEKTETAPLKRIIVQDLECNKAIDKSKAYIVINDNQEYYFCSWDCRNRFLLRHGEKAEQ